jgi:hypothetical protein
VGPYRVVAGTDRTVEIRRRIADHEIDPVGREIDGRILPDAAAEFLPGVAGLGELVLFALDIEVHVAPGGVLCRPDTDRILRDGAECLVQRAGLRMLGLDEAAAAILAAVGSDQHLVFYHGRSHRLAIASFRTGNVGRPDDIADLGVQRDQLGSQRGEIDEITENLDAAIVRNAAIGSDRAHLVSVVPELDTGLSVERVDVTRRDIHDAVDDDGRRLQRFLDVGLENSYASGEGP